MVDYSLIVSPVGESNDSGVSTTSVHGVVIDKCQNYIPSAEELFKVQPLAAELCVAVAAIFTMLTLAIYIEEVHFIIRHFPTYKRRVKVIWLLAVYPVFSFCGFLGAVVPRAGTLVDLVANTYFGTCLFQFVRLMLEYMGGEQKMWHILGDNRVSLRAPPCCCCCCCLPTIKFTKFFHVRLQILVLQVSIIRPMLMFIASVLWANGSYLPGIVSFDNAYIYIQVLNLTSTMLGVYGLQLTQNALIDKLGKFQVKGKFLSLQAILLCTILPNIIINFLVSYSVIPCTDFISSKARGERFYHGLLVVLMLPLCLIGRRFYRREHEGVDFVDEEPDTAMTSTDDERDEPNANDVHRHLKEVVV